MTDEELEFFEHYGVKGMRWGVRNEKKTSTKQDRREAKAQKFDAKAAAMDTKIADLNREIDRLPNNIRGYYKKSGLQVKTANAAADRDRFLKDASAARKGKLTTTQKHLLVGGIIVGSLVAGGAYTTGKESGQINSLQLKGEALIKSKSFSLLSDPLNITKNPDLMKTNMSPDEVLSKVARQVNPMYNTPGGHMNCRRSTFTHELRRRGYDVRATTTTMGWGQSESGLINALTTDSRDKFRSTSLSSMVAGGKGIRGQIVRDSRVNPAKTTSSINHLIRESKHIMPTLAKQPSGARGEVVFNFGKFAHSMAYEVFEGKPVIFDSQKGVMYDAVKGIEEMTRKWGVPSGAEITRLDNVDLDMKFLSRWATKAGSK